MRANHARLLRRTLNKLEGSPTVRYIAGSTVITALPVIGGNAVALGDSSGETLTTYTTREIIVDRADLKHDDGQRFAPAIGHRWEETDADGITTRYEVMNDGGTSTKNPWDNANTAWDIKGKQIP